MSGVSALQECLQQNSVPRRRLLGEQLSIVRTLGSGSFGDVILVEDRDANGILSVVKRFRNNVVKGKGGTRFVDRQVKAAMDEARVMLRFNDDGIVRLTNVWYEEPQGVVCILMEYCPKGDMEGYLRQHFPFSEETLQHLFIQCLLALAHIHTKEVVHRDVKLSNILVSGEGNRAPTLKIADFGLSTLCKENVTVNVSTFVGTPLFMSPETMVEGVCGYGSDVWGLGVAFYRMMTNRHPFSGNDFAALRQSIMNFDPPHPTWQSRLRYSQELGDLVMSMLIKDPFMRPSARELIASPLFVSPLLHCPWNKKALRGTLLLFACRTNHVMNIFEEPSLNAKIVGTIQFGDHVFVSKELHARAMSKRCSISRSVDRGISLESSAAASDSFSDTTVWCCIVGPQKGYCMKYERGYSLLRHVGDCTPCGPLPTEPTVTDEREFSPEPTRPEPSSTSNFSSSQSRGKTRSKTSKNVFSFLFKHHG